jgi:hypothetical protein
MSEIQLRRCYCDRCREPFAGEVELRTGRHECPRCGSVQCFNLRGGGKYYRIPWRKLGWEWEGWEYSRIE